MKIISNSLAAILVSSIFVWAQPTGVQILKQLEERQKFPSDIHSKVKLTQQKAGQGNKLIEMEYYRRDKVDAFVIRMLAPEADRGNGYLRVADHMWMYRRNTRSFQHVNRDESIGGSDAKADDFETRNLTETYTIKKDKQGKEIISAEQLGKVATWKVEAQALVNDVDYPKKIWWVSQDKFLLLKEEAYSPSGTLMQTAYYLQYTEIQGKFVPVRQLFIDEFEKGNRTVVELSDINTKALDNSIFTKAWLEAQSK